MSSCVLYRKHEYLIVLNGKGYNRYYTVINTNLNTHIHVNGSIKLCKRIIQKAINKEYSKCNEYSLHKIQILLGENEDWNNSHKTKIFNHNLY